MGKLDDMFSSALDSITDALADWELVKHDDTVVSEEDLARGYEIARKRGWL